MARIYNDEFRREAVRIVLTSGLPRRQVASDLGVDLSGYAGLEDKVDHHGWQLFKAAILSSVLSVGSEIGRDRGEDDVLQALRDCG